MHVHCVCVYVRVCVCVCVCVCQLTACRESRQKKMVKNLNRIIDGRKRKKLLHATDTQRSDGSVSKLTV